MAVLTVLSNELKLMIIEYLFALVDQETATPGRSKNEGREGDRDRNESSDQPHLHSGGPRPIRARSSRITEILLPLSCTSRSFRALTASYIFNTIVLRNTEKSGASIQLLAQSDYARYVRHIEYISEAPFEEYWIRSLPRDEDFPPSVREILENVAIFPNVRSISVELGISGKPHWDPHRAEYLETEIEMLNRESEHRWRVLARRTYAALSMNAAGVIKSLELREIISTWTSEWDNGAWHALLHRLESFSVSFRGGATEEGGICVGRLEAYKNFVPKFFQTLFGHLKSVKDLRIAASKHGALGIGVDSYAELPEIWIDTPIASAADEANRFVLPRLESLELDWIYIGDHLVQFLQNHATTIRSISLKHAYAFKWGDGTHWRDFFKKLLAADPPFSALQRFSIDKKDRNEDFGVEANDFLVGIAEEDAFEEYQLVNANITIEGLIEVTWDLGEGGDEEYEDWQEDHKFYDEFMALVQRNLR